ncbi:MAG TPA: hypothetical protein VFL31_06455 [Nitrospiraceae bacterium]|nr:hypothetical protein [Nitrospiraceae bacterium]
MLRLLFQSIEQSLGPSLSQVAGVIYWTGVILLACAVLVPVYRVLMECAAARRGLKQHWVMTCPTCGKLTLVTDLRCGHCDGELDIPWTLKRWASLPARHRRRWIRYLKWAGHLLGSAGFLLLSIWVATAIGALAPQGELHRLFIGFALTAWAAVGWFGGRMLRLGPRGILARVGDALLALAAIGAMAIALFFADAARPISETQLASFTTLKGVARIGEQLVPLPQGEIGFEYLQLDHELFGYHRVISVGFSSGERVPVPRSAIAQGIVDHLRQYAGGYARRGLTVRLRTERILVSPDQSYEVIQREGQVLIRRVDRSSHPVERG